jgi:hypothetical protein
MILYKMKVGCPCPSASVLGPGLVMYQDSGQRGPISYAHIDFRLRNDIETSI